MARIKELADYFREKLKEYSLPFKIVSESFPNAVTPLSPTNEVSANDIFLILKDEYYIGVCPNGGNLKDKVFRVGHVGALEKKDYDFLLDSLLDMRKRNLI